MLSSVPLKRRIMLQRRYKISTRFFELVAENCFAAIRESHSCFHHHSCLEGSMYSLLIALQLIAGALIATMLLWSSVLLAISTISPVATAMST